MQNMLYACSIYCFEALMNLLPSANHLAAFSPGKEKQVDSNGPYFYVRFGAYWEEIAIDVRDIEAKCCKETINLGKLQIKHKVKTCSTRRSYSSILGLQVRQDTWQCLQKMNPKMATDWKQYK